MAETTSSRTRRASARSSQAALRRAATLAPGYAIVIHENSRGGEGTVELARVLGARGPEADVQLEFSSGASASISRMRWNEVHGELKSLIREELAPLPVGERDAMMQRLVDAMAGSGWASLRVSTSFYGIREVLRERLPQCVIEAGRPAGLSVESLLAVDDSSFWISGWLHDEEGEGTVAIVSPEGARTEVMQEAFRYDRPDVVKFYARLGPAPLQQHGFTAYFSTPAPSLLAAGWLAELYTAGGFPLETACPTVVGDPQAVRSAILGELAGRGPVGGPLASDHGRYALTRLQARICAESKLAEIEDYGPPVRNPLVSIIVPLFKRLDFIEHQLLHFSRDPDFAETELIYVLDSVEQREELAAKARELFTLYGLPFRVVNLTAGGGFAAANQHGIAAARAKRLLLLNSDVIPAASGWIGAMSRFYDATDRIGALGPKLLYEDDSLQHAGLYFHRTAGSSIWENAHCFKGQHRDFPAANLARAVPAVTAACMLVDRELYEQVGGLPLHYAQGDYEDSELCLEMLEAGRENWYLPSVELYHLEGQSYVPGERRVYSEYNMWLHTELWGESIERVMGGFDPFATLDPSPAGAESRA